MTDGWKKVLIPVQHMFPNCAVKYKTTCTSMKDCDIPVLPKTVDFPSVYMKKVKLKITKPPEGFENVQKTLPKL